MISKSVPARARTRTFAIGIDYITDHTHQRAVAAAGASFEGGVTYATAPEKAAWIHLRGVSSLETAWLEMEAVAALSARCRDPVYHLIIAYAKHERPTRAQVVGDAERLLTAIGMEDHQYVLAAHRDTDDFHAHVIANRVGPDGRANALWHERIIRERVCAEISGERGWDIVVGHHNRDIVQRIERLHDLPPDPERRPSDGAYRRSCEWGEPLWQDVARPYVLDAVDRAEGWSDLHQRLAAHGVVVKLVQRGDRVQGLAFAEGLDRKARGCGASRIDTRCALSALERRFGPFSPEHDVAHDVAPAEQVLRAEPVVGKIPSQQWSDKVRPTILEAVDAAGSWPDLAQRLGRHGIVVKLVERGGRIQGLAFAQGRSPDVPGCGASRIDQRCKKAALENRFGPFPSRATERTLGDGDGSREARRAQEDARQSSSDARQARERKAERLREARERSRLQQENGANPRVPGHLREGLDRDVGSEPSWAVREAGYIADHARVRSAYATYRSRFFEGRRRAIDARRNGAWERERAQRLLEAQRRRDAGQLLRATARLGSRGLARQVAYWSINAIMARRRAQEYAAARVRWQATKIVLASEHGLAREEKPMDYRSFVTERARAGDRAAQRVLAEFERQTRETAAATERQVDASGAQPRRSPQVEARTLSLDQVRARLEVIRAEEEARRERARLERERLERVAPPKSLEELLAVEREGIRTATDAATALTDAERMRLRKLAGEKRSWNPLTRVAAARIEETLRAAHRSRYETSLRAALEKFERREVPQYAERAATDERRYRQYITSKLALEDEMREAQAVLRKRLPNVEQRLEMLERGGVTRIDAGDLRPNARLNELAAAIDRRYLAIPEAMRRDIERSIRHEQRALDRSREYISMGGR
jgi:hypothetical protein